MVWAVDFGERGRWDSGCGLQIACCGGPGGSDGNISPSAKIDYISSPHSQVRQPVPRMTSLTGPVGSPSFFSFRDSDSNFFRLKLCLCNCTV
jgi:hypothetical protein